MQELSDLRGGTLTPPLFSRPPLAESTASFLILVGSQLLNPAAALSNGNLPDSNAAPLTLTLILTIQPEDPPGPAQMHPWLYKLTGAYVYHNMSINVCSPKVQP